MTADSLPSALKHAVIDLARNYNVCELDGRIMLSTADSEEATRVLALDPSRRCVVREGAVLRWGANVPAGEKSAAMIFLRKLGLVTSAPVKSHVEMRGRIAAPRAIAVVPATRRPVVHRDVKPAKGETVSTNCKSEGCTNPAIAPRETTPAWRVGLCRKCIDRIRHRKDGPATASSAKPASKPKTKRTCSNDGCNREVTGASKRADLAALCGKCRQLVWARESNARRAGITTPKRAPKKPPAGKPPTVTARPAVARDIPESFEHALRCMAIVAQLGGIERAERIAEALA